MTKNKKAATPQVDETPAETQPALDELVPTENATENAPVQTPQDAGNASPDIPDIVETEAVDGIKVGDELTLTEGIKLRVLQLSGDGALVETVDETPYQSGWVQLAELAAEADQ